MLLLSKVKGAVAMTRTAEATSTHVQSVDGTRIAVYISGEGRPLVVVHGTTSDHTTWRLALPFLERHVEVHAVDRRGRGHSGDTGDRQDYDLDKECEDVAAVVEAAAAASGSPVDLLGHSYGGNIAFRTASRTGATNIRKLVLYEGWPPPRVAHRLVRPDLLAHLEKLLAHDRPEEMLVTFYRDIVLMSEEEVTTLQASPTWPARVAAAGTVPRELRAFGEHAFDPATAARIDVPVLLLVGEDSPDEIKADPDIVATALPDARVRVLAGQAHMAHLTAPETFADEVWSFLRG
jgi:pimeloyl-ACP methyl ester carboxylesterase